MPFSGQHQSSRSDSAGFQNPGRVIFKTASGGGFATLNALAIRSDYSASDVRELARRAKDDGQARRLLTIPSVMDGAARKHAAKLGEWIARPCAIGSSVSMNGDRTVSSTFLRLVHHAAIAQH